MCNKVGIARCKGIGLGIGRGLCSLIIILSRRLWKGRVLGEMKRIMIRIGRICIRESDIRIVLLELR